MSTGTLILILEGAGVLGAATLVFITGHKLGCWSRRHDYPRAWDAGQKAERDRWEDATGTTWDSWQARRDAALEGEWPYGFSTDPAIPPAALLLADDAAERLAAADAALAARPRVPGVPTVAEIDEMAAAYKAAQGVPVVADITDAARWRPSGWTDAPTVTGVVVTTDMRRAAELVPEDDWDVLAGRALPGYAAAALGGHRTVDECVDSIVQRAVRS